MLKSILHTLGTVIGVVAGMTITQNQFEVNAIVGFELIASMACFYASHKVKS